MSEREAEVLRHVLRGELNKQIAGDLGICERTVKLHRTNIKAKLGVAVGRGNGSRSRKPRVPSPKGSRQERGRRDTRIAPPVKWTRTHPSLSPSSMTMRASAVRSGGCCAQRESNRLPTLRQKLSSPTITGLAFDCLVLDVQLEGISGLEFRDRLSAEGDRTPVIFITAHDEPGTREQALATGCAAYFRKSDPGDAVLAAIRQAVARSGPRSAMKF